MMGNLINQSLIENLWWRHSMPGHQVGRSHNIFNITWGKWLRLWPTTEPPAFTAPSLSSYDQHYMPSDDYKITNNASQSRVLVVDRHCKIHLASIQYPHTMTYVVLYRSLLLPHHNKSPLHLLKQSRPSIFCLLSSIRLLQTWWVEDLATLRIGNVLVCVGPSGGK